MSAAFLLVRHRHENIRHNAMFMDDAMAWRVIFSVVSFKAEPSSSGKILCTDPLPNVFFAQDDRDAGPANSP